MTRQISSYLILIFIFILFLSAYLFQLMLPGPRQATAYLLSFVRSLSANHCAAIFDISIAPLSHHIAQFLILQSRRVYYFLIFVVFTI
jgi:hypothetical protein